MLYDTRIRYLASVFVDAASVLPTPEAVTAVMQILGDGVSLPMSVYQQGPSGPIPRMGFQSANGEWRVFLLGERFDVSHHPTDLAGSNMIAFEGFCSVAAARLVALLKHFDRKAHRLAAVEEGLLPTLPSDEKAAIVAKLLLLPPTFQAHPPFEWDWRAASHVPRLVGGAEEKTNTILTVRRMAGSLQPPGGEQEPFDRVRVDVDTNTTPGNAVARFGEPEVSDFLAKAPHWHAELSNEFLRFLGLEANDGEGC